MKNDVLLKRDSGSLSETFVEYKFSVHQKVKAAGILENKHTLEDLESCKHESITQFLIFFFFFLAHRILLATMSG